MLEIIDLPRMQSLSPHLDSPSPDEATILPPMSTETASTSDVSATNVASEHPQCNCKYITKVSFPHIVIINLVELVSSRLWFSKSMLPVFWNGNTFRRELQKILKFHHPCLMSCVCLTRIRQHRIYYGH